MNSQPIGIFDSGVGGLSVFRELVRLLPRENYIFFGDQKNFPYGEKSKPELIVLTSRILDFFVEREAKLVVAACNTATCYAINELRENFKIPIVGVVPAIKVAAENTKTGKIALIATPATVKSDYIKELVKENARGVIVKKIGCSGLENAVEEGTLDSLKTKEILKKYIAPLKNSGVDQLVLGCTHYPFLKKQIGKILGPKVALADSGDAVARRVQFLLKEREITGGKEKGGRIFYTNKDEKKFSRVASELLGYKINAEKISI
ncbi:MAG: glutamate racemase [Patescibacteria group bacterium]